MVAIVIRDIESQATVPIVSFPCDNDEVCETAAGEWYTWCQDCPPACGDGICSPGEDAQNCLPDCCQCGDKLCQAECPADADCFEDCPCGDGKCVGGESAESCPTDCCLCGDGKCEEIVCQVDAGCATDCSCGNGKCNPEFNETNASCPQDCHCGDLVCDWTGDEPGTCQADCCHCDDVCNGMCSGSSADCATDCPPCLGIPCHPEKFIPSAICVSQCPCGDGVCDFATSEENLEKCPADCCKFDSMTGKTLENACGDAHCCGPENETACPADCAIDGDTFCSASENPAQSKIDCCGPCGDGICKGYACGEDSPLASCPVDCGGNNCGNGVCDKGESFGNCPLDCKWQTCGDGDCSASDGGSKDCPTDCGAPCGDAKCDGGESWLACPQDCGYCGDGICSETGDETVCNCAWDCAAKLFDGACQYPESANWCWPGVPCDCTGESVGVDTCSQPLCGDGCCANKESAASCPADCAATSGTASLSCGDGFCSAKDLKAGCTDDCGLVMCAASAPPCTLPNGCGCCGDLLCKGKENAKNCPADCMPVSPIYETCEKKKDTCGDGVCESNENDLTCAQDCPCPPGGCTCPDGVCSFGEMVTVPLPSGAKTKCFDDCTKGSVQTDLQYCGNGVCDALLANESAATCPADCQHTCGDTVCDGNESPASCPWDCGSCGDGVCSQAEQQVPKPIDLTAILAQCPPSYLGAWSFDGAKNWAACLQSVAQATCAFCWLDCAPACGDGLCESNETAKECPTDCVGPN